MISYNPGYQNVLKDLKPSTKQRFVAIEFDYPTADIEASIVEREAGIAHDLAVRLVKLGGKIRNLKNHGLEEGVSTLTHLRRDAHPRGYCNRAGLRRGDCQTHYRRCRHAAQHYGTGQGHVLTGMRMCCPRCAKTSTAVTKGMRSRWSAAF